MVKKKSSKKGGSGAGKFFLGAAAGTVAGVAIGVLTAPKSGEEVRKVSSVKSKNGRKSKTSSKKSK